MDEPVGTGRDSSCGPIDGQVFVRFVLVSIILGGTTHRHLHNRILLHVHDKMSHHDPHALPLPNINDKRHTFHHSDTSDTPKQYHFSSRDAADTLSLLGITRPSSKIALCASLADIIFCTSVESSSSKPSDGFCKTILVNPLTR